MTEFAIINIGNFTQASEKEASTDKIGIGFIAVCIIVFDIYLAVAAIIGFILDRSKKLILY
jgi:hypothetical protein